ncbi:MAG: 16S rRNA (cytosine(1402)-N(4))-methyltransferase RsmH [Candidatus Pacebacteria bacterium]|nr:16S rRNA (cytosine(1402)-N(4))-methyltransferase RsmH [Candidatus Paceibacterota bacterium]
MSWLKSSVRLASSSMSEEKLDQASNQPGHISVLLQEIIDGLAITTGDILVDCTLGGAGHSEALLADAAKREQSSLVLVGLDADPLAIERSEEKLRKFEKKFNGKKSDLKIFLKQSNFRHLAEVLDQLEIKHVNKILMDLGLSSFQLDQSGRGFSFRYNEPLDMTFDKGTLAHFNARDIVNDWDEENIADVIYAYGEERFARRIARKIVEARQLKSIETTDELVEIIKQSVPTWYAKGKGHPATKTFQALRIAVNDELRALTQALEAIISRLAPDGRLAIISFHSLEDRIVKQAFRKWKAEEKGILVNKKPIVPSRAEILSNPRARSAKLRIFEKKE